MRSTARGVVSFSSDFLAERRTRRRYNLIVGRILDADLVSFGLELRLLIGLMLQESNSATARLVILHFAALVVFALAPLRWVPRLGGAFFSIIIQGGFTWGWASWVSLGFHKLYFDYRAKSARMDVRANFVFRSHADGNGGLEDRDMARCICFVEECYIYACVQSWYLNGQVISGSSKQ